MQYVEKIRATVESLLFITNEPLNVAQICELAELEEDDVLDVLDWLIEDYSDDSKGIGVIKLGDGYIMAIKQEYLPYVEKLYRPQISTLSMAALETLAIIAYKQPVTRGEVVLFMPAVRLGCGACRWQVSAAGCLAEPEDPDRRTLAQSAVGLPASGDGAGRIDLQESFSPGLCHLLGADCDPDCDAVCVVR